MPECLLVGHFASGHAAHVEPTAKDVSRDHCAYAE